MYAPSVFGRITVNLTEKAAVALMDASELSGDSGTDTINRAIQIYQFILERTAAGDDLMLRHPDGLTEKVSFD